MRRDVIVPQVHWFGFKRARRAFEFGGAYIAACIYCYIARRHARFESCYEKRYEVFFHAFAWFRASLFLSYECKRLALVFLLLV